MKRFSATSDQFTAPTSPKTSITVRTCLLISSLPVVKYGRDQLITKLRSWQMDKKKVVGLVKHAKDYKGRIDEVYRYYFFKSTFL